MISDVLSEVVPQLDHYLNDEFYNENYQGELRTAIIELRNMALALMVTLDTFPGATPAYRQKQDSHLAATMTVGEYASWKALQSHLAVASAVESAA